MAIITNFNIMANHCITLNSRIITNFYIGSDYNLRPNETTFADDAGWINCSRNVNKLIKNTAFCFDQFNVMLLLLYIPQCTGENIIFLYIVILHRRYNRRITGQCRKRISLVVQEAFDCEVTSISLTLLGYKKVFPAKTACANNQQLFH